jgi:hypothetical protein
MTKLSAQIGQWAAWTQTIVGYTYVAVFIVLVTYFSVRPWTDIQTFASEIGSAYFLTLTGHQVLAFLQALLVLVLAITIYEYASPDKKILARLGIAFALAFAILSSMNYYIQWVGVRQSILSNDLTGLGLFVQFNDDSPMFAINMLGWTFFYGLTTLVLAPIFNHNRLESWIRWAFIINGIGCIITAILLAFGQKWVSMFWILLVSITWYAYPLLGIRFRQLRTRLAS